MNDEPTALKPGDTIGVAAPSARFDRELMAQGVACLESMGFKVRVPDEIHHTRRYLAGDDQERARVLTRLFTDPDVKGIIAVRGGYGAMRILPYLDWDLLREHPTWVIGFSDATALINLLNQRCGSPAVHGPNLVSLAKAGAKTLDGFKQAVFGHLDRLSLSGDGCLVPGRGRGGLAGGNLATLVHLCGTPYEPDFGGKILFIEDVGEPAYKLDRMLSQMKMAGCFDGIQGVVAGSFENCANPEYIPEILTEIFEPYQVPVAMGLEAGHGEVNLAFPMGGKVVLDTESCQLIWEAEQMGAGS